MQNTLATIQYNPTTMQPETIQLYTYEDAVSLYKERKAQKKQKIIATIKKTLDQKIAGIGLLAIGIIGCCLIPEEATAFIFSGIIGIARLVTN